MSQSDSLYPQPRKTSDHCSPEESCESGLLGFSWMLNPRLVAIVRPFRVLQFFAENLPRFLFFV
jgi:hypothetical protein